MGLLCKSPNFQAEEFSFNAVYVVSFHALLRFYCIFRSFLWVTIRVLSGAKIRRKWDWQGKNEIFSSKKLTEWDKSCNFVVEKS